MPTTMYEVIWIFMIYAVVGWCCEVAYAALNTGKFVNRGFLNGPYCPIYGCGVLVVVVTLVPLKDNLFILYVGSFLVTSLIEFITGFILEKAFHNKWWDYSNEPFNIKGYVCLKFSIIWGFGCTFIVLIVHPIIYGAIKLIPFVVGVVILSVIGVIFVVDCGITVATILKFNERLKLMNEIADKIHHISDEIGENIYEGVSGALEIKENFTQAHEEQILKITEKRDEIAENITEKTQESKIGRNVRKIEMENLKEQYKNLLEQKITGHNRLMKAFPKMKSLNNNETLQKLRTYMESKKKEKK